MTFHPTMKRRLHERLHPLIGEEEADALLDEISPPDPVTREWLRGELDGRFARVDERFERIDERFVTKEYFDEKLERFATKEWTEERFATKEYLAAKLEGQDLRLEGVKHELMGAIHSLEIRMTERFREQTVWTVGGIGVIATVLSIVQAIWG